MNTTPENRKEIIKGLLNKIHGNLVPAFYWRFHPVMFYWYNEELDCMECDCGLRVPIPYPDDELSESNLINLIWDMRIQIYNDYLNHGFDIGCYPD